MEHVTWWLLGAWLIAGGFWYIFLWIRGLLKPRQRGRARQLAWAIGGGILMWLGFALSSLHRSWERAKETSREE